MSYLDGVRVWAALIVLFYHGLMLQFRAVDPLFSYRIGWLFTDGTLAVYIFFVLSGFALSIRFVQTGDLRVVQTLALRRYPRLWIPIFAASLASYLLTINGLYFHERVAPLVQEPGLAALFPASHAPLDFVQAALAHRA